MTLTHTIAQASTIYTCLRTLLGILDSGLHFTEIIQYNLLLLLDVLRLDTELLLDLL